MKRYLFKHILQYILILLVSSSVLITLFLLEDRQQKILIIYSLASLYLLWGILHHYYEHDLSLEVVLEYLIFATVILWVLVNII